MPIVSSSTSPMDVVRRPGVNYDFRIRTMYMPGNTSAPDKSESPEPQAFLIEIGAPGGSIPPHFHGVKQFQVFIEGNGSLGRSHGLAPVAVHYTDSYTTYGPILISEEGMSYFTLRSQFDPGAQYMPESRDRERGIPGKPGRNLSGHVPAEFLADGHAQQTDVVTADVLGPDADGLHVWVTRAGSDVTLVGPDPASGDGAYWLVLKGSLSYGGELLPEKSLLYVKREEAPLLAEAGPDGVVMVSMQFGTTGNTLADVAC